MGYNMMGGQPNRCVDPAVPQVRNLRQSDVGLARSPHKNYNREICRQFASSGSCTYGENCRFTHGTPNARSMATSRQLSGMPQRCSSRSMMPQNIDGNQANHDDTVSTKADLDLTARNHPPLCTSSPLPPHMISQQHCAQIPFMQAAINPVYSNYYSAYPAPGQNDHMRPSSVGAMDDNKWGAQTMMSGYPGQMVNATEVGMPQQPIYGSTPYPVYFSGASPYANQPAQGFISNAACPGYYNYLPITNYQGVQTANVDGGWISQPMAQGVQTEAGGASLPENYKTRMCRTFSTNGVCSYGNGCNFAHGQHELRGSLTVQTQEEPMRHYPNVQGQYVDQFGVTYGGQMSTYGAQYGEGMMSTPLATSTPPPNTQLLGYSTQQVYAHQAYQQPGMVSAYPHQYSHLNHDGLVDPMTLQMSAINLNGKSQQPPYNNAFQGTPQSSGNYKTNVCNSFLKTGTCLRGDKCRWTHVERSTTPLSTGNGKYKTRLCKNFEPNGRGECNYGDRCEFIHPNDREYRKSATPRRSYEPKNRIQHLCRKGSVDGSQNK